MKFTNFQTLGIYALLLLALTACRLDEFQEVDSISFQQEIALPLVNTSVSIQDFLDRSSNDLSFLTIEADGGLTLSYQEEANALLGLETLEELPKDFPLPVPDQTTTIPLSSIQEISINSADFKSGRLNFELRSSLPEDLEVQITLPNISKNGQVLSFNVSLDYQGNTPVEAITPSVDLSDYLLATTDGDLTIQYEALNGSNQSREVDMILGNAENWSFKSIEGAWDEKSFPMEVDTVDIDLYENIVAGDLYFSDPRLGLIINNSFGIPVKVNLKEVSILTVDEEIVKLAGTALDEGFLVAAPSANQQGQSRQSVFTLDRTNSNIAEVFNAMPKMVWYRVEVVLAPGAGLTEGFVLEESQIDVSVSFELPIEGKAKNFVTEQIVEMDLGEEENLLKEAQLKLITANQIPIDVDLQLYFLDEAEQKVDSIFNDVTTVVQSNSPEITTLFDLSPARIQAIRQSKKIMIRSEFSTADDGNTEVRILNHQEMAVRLGLRATIVQ